MRFSSLLPLAGAVLAGVASAGPLMAARADENYSVAKRHDKEKDKGKSSFPIDKNLVNANLYTGPVPSKDGISADADLFFGISSGFLKGSIDVDFDTGLLKSPSLEINLGGVSAYLEIDVSASAEVHVWVNLLGAAGLDLNLPGLLDADVLAGLTIDLCLDVSAAIDAHLGLLIEFNDSHFIKIDPFSKEIVDQNTEGFVVKPTTTSLGAEVALAAQVTVGLKLRAFIELGLQAGVSLLGLDIGAGAVIGVALDLFDYTAVFVPTPNCLISVTETVVIRLGIAANIDVSVGKDVDLHLDPQIWLEIAASVPISLCLGDAPTHSPHPPDQGYPIGGYPEPGYPIGDYPPGTPGGPGAPSTPGGPMIPSVPDVPGDVPTGVPTGVPTTVPTGSSTPGYPGVVPTGSGTPGVPTIPSIPIAVPSVPGVPNFPGPPQGGSPGDYPGTSLTTTSALPVVTPGPGFYPPGNSSGGDVSYTTSTTWTSSIFTITRCANGISDCPASSTQEIVHSTVLSYTTICPVGSHPTQPSVPTGPVAVPTVTGVPITVTSQTPITSIVTPPSVPSDAPSVPPTITVSPPSTTPSQGGGSYPSPNHPNVPGKGSSPNSPNVPGKGSSPNSPQSPGDVPSSSMSSSASQKPPHTGTGMLPVPTNNPQAPYPVSPLPVPTPDKPINTPIYAPSSSPLPPSPCKGKDCVPAPVPVAAGSKMYTGFGVVVAAGAMLALL